ncbi:hypothetical protein [Salibacterium halotolerans]|uniref:Uncharacterized protein n=1 Tax=Salibacterium halotolerans TaxID=1884432 RepID=A0A1I5YBA0_9BACI|nr:hypothetical protein [Salibacterium halotolerans]SFQ41501.1 hypothetical protein SAMN05518683_13917 [Salibacterium halotolerans]
MTYDDQEHQDHPTTKPILLLDTGACEDDALAYAEKIDYTMKSPNVEEAVFLRPERKVLYYIQVTVEEIRFHLSDLSHLSWQIILVLPPNATIYPAYLLHGHALIVHDRDMDEISWMQQCQLAYDWDYYVHPAFHAEVLKQYQSPASETSHPVSRSIAINDELTTQYLTHKEIVVLSNILDVVLNLSKYYPFSL